MRRCAALALAAVLVGLAPAAVRAACYQPERSPGTKETCKLLFPGGVPIDPKSVAVKGCARAYPEIYGRIVHARPCPAKPAPAAEGVPPECAEAKINIDWVLFKDSGAKATYEFYLGQGESPIDAVISAQGHNPHAQQTIRDCYGWGQGYVRSKGFTAAASPRPRAQPAPKDNGNEPKTPSDRGYIKYWDFSCSVVWKTTLKTGGIVVGLCEEDPQCNGLLHYWRQQPGHGVYTSPTIVAHTNPQGIGVDDRLFARANALENARDQVRQQFFEPLKAKVEGAGWKWMLIDPETRESGSSESVSCTNHGLKDWRIR